MSNCTPKRTKGHFTARATLVAVGQRLRQLRLFQPIVERVQIQQKVVHDTPTQKLLDALIAILAGSHGLVEVNKRVRADQAVQRAFGRERCAEQSVISDTLDACSPENVQQLQEAMAEIYQQHGAGYRHDYTQQWQLLDVDMTGQPCGPKAAFATKGYFAKQRNRRGRQLGRVVASWYQEIVVDRLYDGKTQLPGAFQDLLLAAEQVLDLDEAKRARTILRADAHGGSQDDVNWALRRGYHIHTKEYSADRARKLAASVTVWYDDPKVPGRQVGWVTAPATEYVRPVQRIAVRSRKKNGQWGMGVILSTVPAAAIIPLARLPIHCLRDPLAVLLAYVYFYDLRGGGVETTIKEDKQGLGITKRNKKRFAAQQMLVQLNALAHNLIIWTRQWLAQASPRIGKLGVQRMVRDIFQIDGLVYFGDAGCIHRLILNRADPFAASVYAGLRSLWDPLHVVTNLGQI